MARSNKNLRNAKVNKNDEFKDLTSAQKAKKRWAEKHKKPNEVYLKELRETAEEFGVTSNSICTWCQQKIKKNGFQWRYAY